MAQLPSVEAQIIEKKPKLLEMESLIANIGLNATDTLMLSTRCNTRAT